MLSIKVLSLWLCVDILFSNSERLLSIDFILSEILCSFEF